MKRIFTLLLLAPLACAGQNFLIRGKVQLPSVNHITVSYYVDFNLRLIRDSIELDVNGSFAYDFRLKGDSKYCYIKCGNESINIWAIPYDTLDIQINQKSGIRFSGPSARIQEYLQIESDYWTALFDSATNLNSRMGTALSRPLTDEYFQAHEILTNKRILHLTKFLKDQPDAVTQAFIERQRNDLTFTDLYYKLTYDSPHLDKFQFYNRTVILQENEKNGFLAKYNFTETNPFNNILQLQSLRFLEFSNQFFTHVAVKSIRENNVTGEKCFLREVFGAIDQFVHDPQCNIVQKAYFLQNRLRSFQTFGMPEEADLVEFSNSIANLEEKHPELGCLIRDDFNLMVYRLNQFIGYTAPALDLTDETGLNYSLTSENGRYIYVKVWASWCGPCIQQIPSWNKLVEKFKTNTSVAFIMISIDAREDKWLKGSEEI
jgi:thiol-disulfide isomerase/thioredoxin